MTTLKDKADEQLSLSGIEDKNEATEAVSPELELLRKVVHALLEKMYAARGKNITIRLDNLFSAVPELQMDGTTKSLNEWLIEHNKRLREQAMLAERRQRALAEAGLAKLSADERKALGLSRSEA